MPDSGQASRRKGRDKLVTLVLQGGGALGSYQAGVFEGLAETGAHPDWVAGVSIGAINAAIIAGNAPRDRVDRLNAFWEQITAPSSLWPVFANALTGDGRRESALSALMFGQPGFFAPRPPAHWLQGAAPSFYDMTALRSTLERLVDFDRINARETRFSVAAVNVRNGKFAYFDNVHMAIAPEHVMASAAKPPGFPAVEIDGEHYWDGGIVSNTPLQYVMETIPRRSQLIFQIDLFHANGPLPATLEDVDEREKDIRFSSRTRAVTDNYRRMHDVRHNVNTLLESLPPEIRDTPVADFLYEFGCVTTMDIVQLVYRPSDPQGLTRHYEFSRQTMRERWAKGRADAEVTLAASPWLAPMPPQAGARTFDVLAEQARAKRAAMASTSSAMLCSASGL
jgi:NTE family protein